MTQDKYERVAERIVRNGSGSGWSMMLHGQDIGELAIKQIAAVLREEFSEERENHETTT